MSKTKTTASKIAAGVVSLAMSVSFVFGGAVAPAQAQSTDQALLDTIATLNATIASLQAELAALRGGSTTTTTSTGAATTGTGYQFTVNLSAGDTGNDVMELQKFLNTDPATQVAVSGAGSPGNETSYFGPATKAAVIKWQNKNAAQVLTPVGLSVGTGYFGSSSRAFANTQGSSSSTTGTTGGGTTTVTPTGNTLNVSLASDSPAASVLVVGQAIGDLAHFTFTNTSATDAKVTKLTMNRTGVSADSVLSNVYLFEGATRLTDAATVSSGVISVHSSAGLFTVPAGTSKTISVRSDISGGSGQIVGVSLASVESNVAVSASFPVAGATHSIATGTMGTVVLTYTGPTGATENPADEVRVFEASTVVSTNDARLESLTVTNRGTTRDGDLQNFKLFVDGVQVGSTVAQTTNDTATFDLSANPVNLDTGTRIIKVLADIVKGSSETFNIQLKRASDLRVVDTEFNQPILATTFPVAPGSANTVAAGSLSVTKAANSPSKTVAVGATNVLWGSFEFRATGEDIKIEAANVWVDHAATAGMDNAKVFVNGSQVGSTKDIVADANPDDDGTEFTFGSSFIAKAGEITKVDIYGDAKTSSATNYAAGTAVDVGISILAADTEGLNSGNTVTAISEVEGNSRTIVASTLTGSKSTGLGDKTVIAGTNNAKIGSFVLAAGSTEGINVNTIVINLDSVAAATITDLMLKEGDTQLGTTKAVPSIDNSFSVNFEIPASDSKTIDIYANVKAGSGIGDIVATLDSTTGGTGAITANSATTGSDVTLQTTSVGSGSLEVTASSASTLEDYVALAGTTGVHVGSFEFKSITTDHTLREILVKIPNDVATSVTHVTLRTGSTDIATRELVASSTLAYATSTFTGLNVNLPVGKTIIDVLVDIPSVESAGAIISGKGITALLAGGAAGTHGFVATNSAGTEDTILDASDVASTANSGKGTVYVRHSIPTLTAGTETGTPTAPLTLSNATEKIAQVKIAADNNGIISWKKLVFNVDKTAGVTIGATSTLQLKSGSTVIAGTFATTTGDFSAQSQALASSATSGNLVFVATTEQEIEPGSSKTYTLEGDVTISGSGYESLTVKIADTSTSASTAAFSTLHTAAGDVSETFVWSDLAADEVDGTHTESTLDWTNDYLIDDLEITVGSFEKNN